MITMYFIMQMYWLIIICNQTTERRSRFAGKREINSLHYNIHKDYQEDLSLWCLI
jgi:hypothetical protein